MPVIYLDVLIVLNWFVDYLLISATGCILRVPMRRIRRMMGALFGGLCSLILLLPTLPTSLSLLVNFVFAMIIILIAFPWLSFKAYAKELFIFFLFSAMLAGLVSALWQVFPQDTYIAHNGIIYVAVSPLLLALFSVISYGAIRLYDRITQKHVSREREYTLCITEGEQSCTCRALYDTGLHLKEPFSGSPVIIMNTSYIQPILSSSMQQALFKKEEALKNGSTCYKEITRVRQIPYRALEKEGMIPAFMPNGVFLKTPSKPEKNITGVYVALTDSIGCGEYAALIGSDIADG